MMKIIGKILIVVAALIFVGGVVTLFWDEAPGQITNKRIIARTYSGNGGMNARGVTYQGGTTEVRLIEYRYSVDGHQYTSASIQFSGGTRMAENGKVHFYPTPTKIYHSSIFPSLSVLRRGIPVFSIFMLVILGLGLIEMQRWIMTHVKNGIGKTGIVNKP